MRQAYDYWQDQPGYCNPAKLTQATQQYDTCWGELLSQHVQSVNVIQTRVLSIKKCAHIIKPNLQCWHNVLEHSTEHRQHAQLQSVTLQPQANAANVPPFLIVCKD